LIGETYSGVGVGRKEQGMSKVSFKFRKEGTRRKG